MEQPRVPIVRRGVTSPSLLFRSKTVGDSTDEGFMIEAKRRRQRDFSNVGAASGQPAHSMEVVDPFDALTVSSSSGGREGGSSGQ